MPVNAPRPRLPVLLLALMLGACADDVPSSAPDEAAKPPASREEWWNGATRLASGRERILAPRELLALLREARTYGWDEDADWWQARRRWVFERVLRLAPDDVEANAALGRRTLRGIDGFAELWERVQTTTVPNEAIETLLERFEGPLQGEEAIFLGPDDFEVVSARLREAREHLDRMDGDPGYRAIRVTLERVRNSILGDYPFVYIEVGPFLVFYSARDLQRIEGEDPASEDRRLEPLRELYSKRLEERRVVYEQLLADIRENCPQLWAKRAPAPGQVLLQWIFGDRAWYGDYVDNLPLREPPAYDYRCGFVHEATNWAALWEPEAADSSDPEVVSKAEKAAEAQLRESLAYLAARQLLWMWGKDPEDPLTNHLETSPDHWLKVGWPSHLAARRVETSPVGSAVPQALAMEFVLPPLLDVVERRSGSERGGTIGQDPEWPEDERARRPVPRELALNGFVDLATALVGHLQGERYHAAFERYLLSQLEGGKRGIKWFEECFGVEASKGWADLQEAVYEDVRPRVRPDEEK